VANNLSAFNAQAWSKRIVQKLDPINVGKFLCNTDYEGELQNVGDTVQVRTPGDITMSTYVKGTPISYEDLAPTKEAFTISEAKYFSFKVDDVDQAQNDLSALDIYARRAAVAINNTINAKVFAQYTKALAANKIDEAGAAITLNSSTTQTGATRGVYPCFVKAAELLSTQNVPEDGRWAVVNPVIRTLLLNDTAHFVRASALGDMVVTSGRFSTGTATARTAPGFIGQIAGFDVYMVTNLPSAGANQTFALFGDNQAITYAAQITKLEALRLQSEFADAIRGLLLHDATVFAECSKRLVTLEFAN
jgi:hypothetical protein